MAASPLRDVPNRIADIVGDEEGTGIVKRDADWVSPGLVAVEEAGDKILRLAARTAIREGHEYDFATVDVDASWEAES